MFSWSYFFDSINYRHLCVRPRLIIHTETQVAIVINSAAALY